MIRKSLLTLCFGAVLSAQAKQCPRVEGAYATCSIHSAGH